MNNKSSEVFIKTRSTPASLPFRGQVTKPTTVKWSIDMSKKKQMLENRTKKYKEMDASKKKQMLNRKAVKSRKRKISKLNVDVCIMES